jgi:cytochrome oxidase Cu insertion factor (SCO1/SenC/PrrC family)
MNAMNRYSHRVMLEVVIVLCTASAMAQTKPYPKAQVISATGQIAPDFTLKDQNGKDFRLSDQRGHWVLLFFYRGYW